MSRSDPLSESVEIGIVILVVVLGIIFFITQWISEHWSTILFFIEIVGSIIVIAAILYAIYYIKNYDKIQQEKQRQKEINLRVEEIRREKPLSDSFNRYNEKSDDFNRYNENKSYKKNIKSGDSRYIPKEIVKAVWERDHGRCQICGSKRRIHYDHHIPLSKGGSNTVENMRILCQKCNLKKSDKIE